MSTRPTPKRAAWSLGADHGSLLLDSAYDLYSKSDEPPSVEKLKPYYQGLIERYFPAVVEW